MKHIEVSASKGGVGTSTVASCLAIGLANEGKKVLLIDLSKFGDCFALTGIPAPAGNHIVETFVDGMHMVFAGKSQPIPADTENAYDHVIYDAGTDGFQKYEGADDVYRLGLAPNAYTALRNLTFMKNRHDGLVSVITENNALVEKDIPQVTRLAVVAVMPIKPEISRAIDAGMLSTRYEALIAPWIENLVKLVTSVKEGATA